MNIARKQRRAVGLALMTALAFAAAAMAGEDRVRARIGLRIEDGDRVIQAAAKERVRPGALVRIHVQPLEGAHVYVVHADEKSATLLNKTGQWVAEDALFLPSSQSFYKIDGISPRERFTVICSPEEMDRLSALADGGIDPDQWASLEESLVEKSRIDLTRPTDPPVEIAGNVRGGVNAESPERYLEALPIFSGRGLLVRKHVLLVQGRE